MKHLKKAGKLFTLQNWVESYSWCVVTIVTRWAFQRHAMRK